MPQARMTNDKINIKFGWSWIVLGIISGMFLGMFAFNGPLELSDKMMDYTSLPRRILRLDHISFLGLGFLNIVYGVTVRVLEIKTPKFLSWLFILGAISMSAFLLVTVFYEPFKYALIIPASLLFVAVILFLKLVIKS